MATTFKKIKNNAKTKTVANVLDNTSPTLTFPVLSNTGTKFPTLSDGGSFFVTAYNKLRFSDPGDDPNMRIGLCTARTGDEFTVTWAQSGTPITPVKGSVNIELLLLDQHLLDLYAAINTAELNKAEDAAVVHKAGDVMSGNLTVPKVRFPGSTNNNGFDWLDYPLHGDHIDSVGNRYMGGGGGSILFRPNGHNNSANQGRINSDGSLVLQNIINAPAPRFTTAPVNGGFLKSDAAGNGSWAPLPNATSTLAGLIQLAAAGATDGEIGGTFDKPVLKNVARVIDVVDYGAVGDGKITTGSITAGSPILTAPAATFSAADVGKLVSLRYAGPDVQISYDPGMAASPLYATIISYQSATQVTLDTNATYTVAAQRLVFGTNDTAAIQAAHTALGSVRRMRFRSNRIYCINANIAITKSNIEIELPIDATLIAMNRTATGFKSEYAGMLFLRNPGAGNTQKNVTVFGAGTIDQNFQPETSAVALWGSGNSNSVWATENIRLIGLKFINHSLSRISSPHVQAHGVTDLNLGRIRNFKIRDCDFDGSDVMALKFRGTFFDGVWVEDNEFHNIAEKCMDYGRGSESFNPNRTSRNFFIRRNWFHDTMTADRSYTLYDWGQNSSRDGIISLHIEDNTFDSLNEYNPNDNPNLQLYADRDCRVRGNTFTNSRQCLSLGYSNGGTPWFIDPNEVISIEGNHFVNVFSTLVDYDSNAMALWSNNIFYNLNMGIFHAYSLHSFTVFENNLVINCMSGVEEDIQYIKYTPANLGTGTPSGKDDYPDKYRSIFTIGGQNQYYVRNNRFIDTRKLENPTTTSAEAVTSVAGGTMPARTYYYRYVYTNRSGKTLPSATNTLNVPANSLAKITPRGGSGNGRPADPALQNPLGIAGIENVEIYVGTVSGSETLQATITFADYVSIGNGWTEPTTGLVAGAALPTENTTHTLCKYGVYESIAGGGYLGPNIVMNNDFFGWTEDRAIYSEDYDLTRMVRGGNTIIADNTSGNKNIALDDHSVWNYGDVTGAASFNSRRGVFLKAKLTSNITPTLSDGYIKGKTVILELTQDATGGRTATGWSANIVFNGSTPALSTAPNAVDVIAFYWDGSKWRELYRALTSDSKVFSQTTAPTASNNTAVMWTATASGTKDGVNFEKGDVLITSNNGGTSKTLLLLDWSVLL